MLELSTSAPWKGFGKTVESDTGDGYQWREGLEYADGALAHYAPEHMKDMQN